MKLVVLDGHTLNPGDLSWEGLAEFGEYEVYSRTPPAETLDRARGAGAVLTNKTVLDQERLEALRAEGLEYVGVLATGVNVVDLACAERLGITVTNAPGYGTAAVAQAVFALLLELTNRTGHHDRVVREGRWSRAPDYCFWDFPQLELEGLMLGIIGYGAIGRAVARIGRAFGMRVIAHTRTPEAAGDGITFVGLNELLTRSDVISLNVPLTAGTREMIDESRLERMKPTAFLINTARGPLIDEAALARALHQGKLAGAGLDVLSAEPPPANHPLLHAPNCMITPHIAWAGRNARARLMHIVQENLRAYLNGRPRNLVTS